MNVFKYKALAKNGDKKFGVVLANNCDEAFENICNKKLSPIDISKVYKVSSKVSLEEILMFFLHVDFQLKCGAKINDAIDNFIDFNSNKILNVKLLEISNSLKAGHSLSEAFQNSVFDKTVSGLLKSAEKTGNLSEIISNILEFLKLKNEWKNKVRSILAYPILIVSIALIIMWFCVTILGPQVVSLLNDYNNGDIPILTDFAVNYLPKIGLFFGFISILAFAILSISSISSHLKNKFKNYLLSIPKIGGILQKVTCWQFCKILQIALNSKLDFIKSLELGIDSVDIEKIKIDLGKVKLKILCGHKIFEAFSSLKYMPKSISTAIYIGEEGNNLDNSMKHISDELYKEILSDLKKLGRYLSTGLTLMTGGIFIFILVSVFYPMYNYIEVMDR